MVLAWCTTARHQLPMPTHTWRINQSSKFPMAWVFLASTSLRRSSTSNPGTLLLFPDNKNCLIYDYVRRIRKEFRSDLQTGQVRCHCTALTFSPSLSAGCSYVHIPEWLAVLLSLLAKYRGGKRFIAGAAPLNPREGILMEPRPAMDLWFWLYGVGKKMSLSGHVCRIIVEYNKHL